MLINRAHSLRILIIEDHETARRALKSLLRGKGHVTVEADTVKGALAALRNRFDVICLDLMLPDGNGVEVLRHVRREGLGCKVAVISATDQQGLLAEVTMLKPDAMFGKPLDLDDFFDWLTSQQLACQSAGAIVTRRRGAA